MNEIDGNNDIIPLRKWVQPGNSFKRIVRQLKNNRKKVYSRDNVYRKKAKQKAIQTLIKRNKNNKVKQEITDNDIDFEITAPDENDGHDGDVVYVRYVPAPPKNAPPLIYPHERCKQKLKQIREKKERYRRNAKKKDINFLNKKNATDLLNEHRSKLIEIPATDISAAEAIQYAEPYRDTSKKDEICRKKAKRKAIQTVIKKKAAIDNALLKNTTGTIDDGNAEIDFKITTRDENDRNDDIPPARPISKGKEIYRKKSHEKSHQNTS